MSNIKKHKITLKREKTALLIIDIQERIYKVMRNHEKLIENVEKLVKGIKILNVSIYTTEQYPQGLGSTILQIKNLLPEEPIQKMSFSCCGAADLFTQLKNNGIEQVVVCGIESHVCVQQTVLDLIANDFQVNLPVNAVSSRSKIDYNTSLQRMEKHGAELTTVESILFELLQVSGTPEFKQISSLVK